MNEQSPVTGKGVSKAYVDAGDAATLVTSEAYTDAQIGAYISAGAYTPTLTDLSATPLSSLTLVDDFQFSGDGGIITVSGAIDIRFSAILSSQLVQVEISLPIFTALAFNSEGSCAGTGTGLDAATGLVIFPALVKANVADSMAELDLVQLVALGTNIYRVFIHFTYKSG